MTEPITFATTRHRCPHCRKSWAHKATAAKHLALCFSDPARKTCKTCRHDEPASGTGEPWDYDPGGCALGHEQGTSCVECGEHPEVCGHFKYKPANRLRVLCPAWEAQS